MAQAFRDARHFFAALADRAEELRQALIPMSDLERSKLVTRIVSDSEMVYGVWPDSDETRGVGIQIIKGEDVMPPIVGFETEHEVKVAAIPCVGLAQAIAARDAWGRIEEPEEAAEETDSAARTALAISEVARLVWAAAPRPEGNASNGATTDFDH